MNGKWTFKKKRSQKLNKKAPSMWAFKFSSNIFLLYTFLFFLTTEQLRLSVHVYWLPSYRAWVDRPDPAAGHQTTAEWKISSAVGWPLSSSVCPGGRSHTALFVRKPGCEPCSSPGHTDSGPLKRITDLAVNGYTWWSSTLLPATAVAMVLGFPG